MIAIDLCHCRPVSRTAANICAGSIIRRARRPSKCRSRWQVRIRPRAWSTFVCYDNWFRFAHSSVDRTSAAAGADRWCGQGCTIPMHCLWPSRARCQLAARRQAHIARQSRRGRVPSNPLPSPFALSPTNHITIADTHRSGAFDH